MAIDDGQINEDGLVTTRTAFPSVLMAIGKVGTGKSTRLKRLAEESFERGDVVLDLLDFGRYENACYSLPNTQTHMYKLFNQIIRQAEPSFKGYDFKPSAYPTRVYVPAVKGIPSRLPAIFQPFRISFQSLSFHEFTTLCGFSGSEVAVELLELAWGSKPRDEGFEEFIKRAIRMAGYGSIIVNIDDSKIQVNTAERRSFAPLLRKLKMLWDSGLLCNEDDPLALDLDEVMKDNSVIHSFSMAFIEEIQTPFLVYGYLLRKIYNLRLKYAERYHNMSLIIREVQKIAPNDTEFIGQSISRYSLRAIIRECRDTKIWLYLDTQDPRNVDRDVRYSPYTWFIFLSDKIVVDKLRETFWFADSVANAIVKLPIGGCAVHHRTFTGVPTFYPPPLSHVKAFDEQFVNLWDERVGEYKDWDIEFPDSDKVIKFVIPDTQETKMSASDEYWTKKYIRTWIVYVHRNGATDLDLLCELVGIKKDSYYKAIASDDMFKEYLKMKMGVVSIQEGVDMGKALMRIRESRKKRR